MGVVLAAVGAVVAALLQLTIATRLPGDAAQLNIVLVFAVIWTLVFAFDEGLTWAFVGGLTIDLLAYRPLGSTVFALVLTVGLAAGLGRFLRDSRGGPVLAVFVLSLTYSVIYLLVTNVLKAPVRHLDLTNLATIALCNTLLAVFVSVPVIVVRRRRAERERVAW